MEADIQDTCFAPSERAADEKIKLQSKALESLYGSCSFFDALPNIIIVLNPQRQVILCNRVLLDILGVGDQQSILGLRPGEILRCIHSCDMPGGCGTSEYCRTCGAVNAILESQHGRESYHECRISVQNNGCQESMELGMTAVPIEVDGEVFTLLSIVDISSEKRRRVLERIFFHDVLNTAGGLLGLAELLEDIDDPALAKEFLRDIQSSTKLLVEQIQEQRDLMQAENKELKVTIVRLYSLALLNEVVCNFSSHEVSRDRRIQVDPASQDVVFHSNPQLLQRVLGNMLKNALEASGVGEVVTVGCRLREGRVEFWVNNPGAMTQEVQMQLYQRSFSTKGANRGLGTYSMKMLTERYLAGSISYTVSEEEGTTFYAAYPQYLPENNNF